MKVLAQTSKTLLVLSLITLIGGLAQAASPCDSVKLNGTYVPKGFSQNDDGRESTSTIVITQKGCDVKIVDRQNRAEWTLDLSGKTLSTVPASILKANSTSGVIAHRAMESMKIRTVLKMLKEDGPKIDVTVIQDIPKTPDTHLHRGNPFNVQVKMTGRLSVWGEGPMDDDGNATRIDQVHSIHLFNTKMRVVGFKDSQFPAPIDKAFVSGANYVLGWTDGKFDRTFSFLNLRRIK